MPVEPKGIIARMAPSSTATCYMYAQIPYAGISIPPVMTDAAHVAVAVLAVSLGYFLRTVVPYVNARAREPGLPFDARYAVGGVFLWIMSLWTALTTVEQLPNLFQENLGATFLAYLVFAVGGNHVVFEALDKAKGDRVRALAGGMA